MTQILETQRLLLRPVEHNDLHQFHTLINDPDVAASTFSIPHPLSYKQAENWVDYYADPSRRGNDQHWAICIKPNNDLVGVISVYDFSRNLTQAELGYWIGKQYWNCGYTSEAAIETVNHIRNKFDVKRLVASYQPNNLASQKILNKVGFTNIRTSRILNRKLKNWQLVKLVFLEMNAPVLQESY